MTSNGTSGTFRGGSSNSRTASGSSKTMKSQAGVLKSSSSVSASSNTSIASSAAGSTSAPAPARSTAAPMNAWSKPLQSKTASTPPPPPPGMGPIKSSTTPSTAVTASTALQSYSANSSRSSTPTARSVSSGGAGAAPSASPQQEEVALRERYLHTILSAVGQVVSITLKDGSVLEGVFHTASPFPRLPLSQANQYVLRAAQPKNAAATGRYPQGSTAVIPMVEVISLHIKSLRLDSPAAGTNSGSAAGNAAFSTDTEISRPFASQRDKALQEAGSVWTGGALSSGGGLGGLDPQPIQSNNIRRPGGNNSRTPTPPKQGVLNSRAAALAPSGSNGLGGGGTSSGSGGAWGGSGRGAVADTGDGLKGSIGTWDQFSANEKLFNVKGSYDENLYTTALDKTKLDHSQIKQAERLAREIETSTSTNVHIAQERNQAVEGDYDEEDLYSGVLKEPSSSAALNEPKPQSLSEDSKKKLPASAPTSSKETPAAAIPTPVPPAVQNQPKTKMNYAAAAAKQTAPPGFSKKITKEESATPVPASSTVTPVALAANTSKEATKPILGPNDGAVKPSKEEKKPEKPQKPQDGPKVQSECESKNESTSTKEKPVEPKKADAAAAVDSQPKESKGTKKEPAATTESLEDKKEPIATAPVSAPLPKINSKLNAKAKEFTLNVNAPTFKPGGSGGSGGGSGSSFGGGGPDQQQQHQQQQPNPMMQAQHIQHPHPQQQPFAIDPNTGMPFGMVDPNMHMPVGPHGYMHHPGQMGQPGMMPMLNHPQYPGMRYPMHYPVPDQHQPLHGTQGQPAQQPPQHQPLPPPPPPPPPQGQPMQQPPPQPAPPAGNTGSQRSASQSPMTTTASDEGSLHAAGTDGESSTSGHPPSGPQPPVPQPGQQHQQIPQMPYGMPHGGYYGQMPPHMQGRGGPPGAGYPQQFVPQQMPGPMGYHRPGFMPPGGNIPPNMMRPYYSAPGASMPYQSYGGGGSYEDDGGYRGGGRGRGGRGGRGQRGGRNYRQNSGRSGNRDGNGGRYYNNNRDGPGGNDNRQNPQTPIHDQENPNQPGVVPTSNVGGDENPMNTPAQPMVVTVTPVSGEAPHQSTPDAAHHHQQPPATSAGSD